MPACQNRKLGSAVQNLTVLATVCDVSVLDRMLSTKRRRITERQGVFTTTTEPEATQEEVRDHGTLSPPSGA